MYRLVMGSVHENDRQKITANRGLFSMVPRVGLEPTHLAAGDFESPASTNFATWAVDLAYLRTTL